MEAISREMSYSRQLKKQNDQSLSRLDGGKSCTPIDQSFIKNIGNSFGSSPVMQDGLITHTMCMT